MSGVQVPTFGALIVETRHVLRERKLNDTADWMEQNPDLVVDALRPLHAAVMAGRPAAKPVSGKVRDRSGTAPTYATWQEAAEGVIAEARQLADLPAPSEAANFGSNKEGDGVGFAPNTNGPMRAYLDMVSTLGIEGVPLPVHLNAARLMIRHSLRQSDRAVIMGAVRTLEGEAQAQGIDIEAETPSNADRPPKSAYFMPQAGPGTAHRVPGNHPDSLRYAWDGQRTIALSIPWRQKGMSQPEVAKIIPGAKNTKVKPGAGPFAPVLVGRKDREGNWIKEEGDYWIRFDIGNLDAACVALDRTEPELARALRMVGKLWAEKAPAPAAPPAPLPPVGAAPAGWTGAPAEVSAHHGVLGGVTWDWDPKTNAVVFQTSYLTPGQMPNLPVRRGRSWTDNYGRAQQGRAFVTQLMEAAREASIQYTDMREPDPNDSKRVIHRSAFPVGSIQALTDLMARDGYYPIARPVIEGLIPAWQALESATITQVSREDRLAARAYIRRFLHTMDPEVRAELALDDGHAARKVARVAQSLMTTKPGADAGDVGAFGKWHVTGDGKSIVLQVQGLDLKHAQNQRYGAGYAYIGKLEDALLLVRELDKVNLPLALSIRLGLLTDADVIMCAELDQLASAGRIEEIPDLETRANAQATVDIAMARLSKERPLYPYQQVGVAYARYTEYRCLIGDAMGLGKTAQAIGCIAVDPARLLPAIIIAPTNVVWSWGREGFDAFLPHIKWEVYAGRETTKAGGEKLNTRRPDNSKGDLLSFGTPGGPDVLLIGWDSIRTIQEHLIGKAKCVIVDEAHYAKHANSQRSKAARAIVHSIEHRILLTGTPFENHPEEIWPILHMLDPVQYADRDDFVERVKGGGKRTVFTVDAVTGAKIKRKFKDRTVKAGELTGDDQRKQADALAELRDRLRCVMVRRLKSDVNDQLPPKTRTPVTIDLGEHGAPYRAAEDRLPEWLCVKGRYSMAKAAADWYRTAHGRGRDIPLDVALAETLVNRGGASEDIEPIADEAGKLKGARAFVMQWGLVAIGVFWRAVGRAKIVPAAEWILDFYEENPRRPLVVFVYHKTVVSGIVERLGAYNAKHAETAIRFAVINAATDAKRTSDLVMTYQRGEIDLLICSSKAREGLNLQRADEMLFVEQWWVPSRVEQAEDRIHRGFKKTNVTIYHLLGQSTIDETIRFAINEKERLIKAVLGAEKTKDKIEKGIKHAILGPAFGQIADGPGGWMRCVPSVKQVQAYLDGKYPEPGPLIEGLSDTDPDVDGPNDATDDITALIRDE